MNTNSEVLPFTLAATYPQDYPAAGECAIKMLAAVLRGEVEGDWAEVKRLAQSNAYQNWTDVRALTNEQAQAVNVRSPYDSDE